MGGESGRRGQGVYNQALQGLKKNGGGESFGPKIFTKTTHFGGEREMGGKKIEKGGLKGNDRKG